MMKNKEDAATKSLTRLRGSSYSGLKLELEEIKNCANKRESTSQKNFVSLLKERSFILPLSITMVLFVMIATCGNDTLVYYGPTIFGMIDIGIPSAVLNALPHVGFSIGYAGLLCGLP